MINRILIATCLAALFIILALNIVPLFWGKQVNTFVRQDEISGMAIRHQNRLFTLNFEQQKETVDILNRAIPVGKIEHAGTTPLEFDQIVIYRFKEGPIELTPVTWSEDNSLYFKAPQWSQSYLKEVSKGQLYKILDDSYDRKPYN